MPIGSVHFNTRAAAERSLSTMADPQSGESLGSLVHRAEAPLASCGLSCQCSDRSDDVQARSEAKSAQRQCRREVTDRRDLNLPDMVGLLSDVQPIRVYFLFS